jgi:hypothetical protein
VWYRKKIVEHIEDTMSSSETCKERICPQLQTKEPSDEVCPKTDQVGDGVAKTLK